MKWFTRLIITLVVLSLVFLIYPQKAYAYLDPGTGSYILQMIIASLVGVAFIIKIYLKRIKTFFVDLFFRRSRERKDDD